MINPYSITQRNQNTSVSTSDFMVLFKPPENISNQLKTSCYDCHSNNTQYPWYNRIQPSCLVFRRTY